MNLDIQDIITPLTDTIAAQAQEIAILKATVKAHERASAEPAPSTP